MFLELHKEILEKTSRPHRSDVIANKQRLGLCALQCTTLSITLLGMYYAQRTPVMSLIHPVILDIM